MSSDRSSLQEYAGYIAVFGFGVNALIEYYLYTQIQKLQGLIDAEKASRERLQESLVVRGAGNKPIAEVVGDLLTGSKAYDNDIKDLKSKVFILEKELNQCKLAMNNIIASQQEQMYIKSGSKSGAMDERRGYPQMNPQFMQQNYHAPPIMTVPQETKAEISDQELSIIMNAYS
jgi:hypothetical protein